MDDKELSTARHSLPVILVSLASITWHSWCPPFSDSMQILGLCSVGSVEGWELINDGRPVPTLGLALGFSLSPFVGASLNTKLGLLLGKSRTSFDGASLNAKLGLLLGIEVGLLLSSGVTLADGFILGLELGASVG